MLRLIGNICSLFIIGIVLLSCTQSLGTTQPKQYDVQEVDQLNLQSCRGVLFNSTLTVPTGFVYTYNCNETLCCRFNTYYGGCDLATCFDRIAYPQIK